MQEYKCQKCGLTWFWMIHGPCFACGGELKPVNPLAEIIGPDTVVIIGNDAKIEFIELTGGNP